MSQEEKKAADSEEKKKSKVTVIIIAVLAVAVLALVAVVAYLLGKKGSDGEQQTENAASPTRAVANSARVVLDEESAVSALDEMRKEVEEGMFECNMSTEWSFDNGSAESRDAYVANSENNRHPIYFDVVIRDTGELIYSSPVLPVGTELTNFKLDKEIPAGTYTALCKYVLLQDEESQEEISTANFVITITVRN